MDLKIKKLACTFYFGALDETIEYLTKTRDFLNKLGYKTCMEVNHPIGLEAKDL